MKKSILLLALLVATDILSVLHAQPRYDRTQLNLEHLNRGVVAFRDGAQVIVSWRTLSDKSLILLPLRKEAPSLSTPNH